MAASKPADTKAEEEPFRLLYSYDNRTLVSASDKRRALLAHFRQVKLYGDGSLRVYASRRDAFPANAADAAVPLAVAGHVLNGGRGAAPELVESPVQNALAVLCHADDADAFLGFGCLSSTNSPPGSKLKPVMSDGTVNKAHSLFVKGDFIEQAWADSALVDEKLQGNVLNAWWQEDAESMHLQSVLESESNDGNFSTYFVLTDKRVYAVIFCTS